MAVGIIGCTAVDALSIRKKPNGVRVHVEFKQIDILDVGFIFGNQGIGDLVPVRTPCRCKCHRVMVGELLYVGSVEIHHIDFFFL